MSKKYEIRPYQTDAVVACLAGLRDTTHVPRGILCLPTGAGKTHCFSQIIQEYTRTGLRVLVLVHRKELIEQVRAKLVENGIIAEVEQAGKRASQNALVVIASVQSLQGRRLAKYPLDYFALMVIDECHHSPAKSYTNVIEHFDKTPVLGASATIDRLDKKSLKHIYHSGIWYNYPQLDAILAGYIMEPKPVICNIRCDLRDCHTVGGDYVQAEVGAVIYKQVRSIATAIVKEAGDLLTLTFTPTISSAKILAACRLQAEWAPLWETSGYHLSGCGADCLTTLGIKAVRRLDSRPLRDCRADQGRIDSLSGPGPMFR